MLSWLWSKGKLTSEQGQVITVSKLYQIIVERVQETYIQKTSPEQAALALNAPMESKAEETVVDYVNTFLECLAFHAIEKETLIISAEDIKAALVAILPEEHYAPAQRVQLLESATDKLGF